MNVENTVMLFDYSTFRSLRAENKENHDKMTENKFYKFSCLTESIKQSFEDSYDRVHNAFRSCLAIFLASLMRLLMV